MRPPSANQVVASIYAAGRMALLDKRALSVFDNKPSTAWQSFFAMFLMAPVMAVFLGLQYLDRPLAVDLFTFALIQSLAYVIRWFALPVVMDPLSKAMGCNQYYCRYVTVLNWSTTIQMMVSLPVLVLATFIPLF